MSTDWEAPLASHRECGGLHSCLLMWIAASGSLVCLLNIRNSEKGLYQAKRLNFQEKPD